MQLAVSKYSALGNSFLVVSAPKRATVDWPSVARHSCDPQLGIGADGLAVVSHDDDCDGVVSIFNRDGSRAERSGNALRILGLHHYRETRRRRSTWQSNGNIESVQLVAKENSVWRVQGTVGRPSFATRDVGMRVTQKQFINQPLAVGDVKLPASVVSTGNPHCVIVCSDFAFDWETIGSEIASSRHFRNGVNVEFVIPATRSRLKVAIWERGVGVTSSSGTGAAAAVAVGVMMGIANRQSTVDFEAGSVDVNWSPETGVIDLTGPVVFVADAEVAIAC